MTDEQATEQRALGVSMVGTLFMGIAGIAAAILSNSQAILLDGLFSFVGFAAAIFARRVSRRVNQAPDRIRPFGYGADESIFTTFRALSLLGVVLFAIVNALRSIGAYIAGQPPTPLNFGPITIYLMVILLTCAILWTFHYRAWRKSGKQSDILKLEANAAAFDGAVTVAAGAGLFLVTTFKDGPMAAIAPIGDSLIVLILCSLAAFRYLSDFRAGLAELAGVAAPGTSYATVRRAIRDPLEAWGGDLVDLSVVKTGRSHSIAVFVDPGRPVAASELDALREGLEKVVRIELGQINVFVVITSAG